MARLQTLTELMESDDLGFACLAAREEIRRQVRQAKWWVSLWEPAWAKESRRG